MYLILGEFVFSCCPVRRRDSRVQKATSWSFSPLWALIALEEKEETGISQKRREREENRAPSKKDWCLGKDVEDCAELDKSNLHFRRLCSVMTQKSLATANWWLSPWIFVLKRSRYLDSLPLSCCILMLGNYVEVNWGASCGALSRPRFLFFVLIRLQWNLSLVFMINPSDKKKKKNNKPKNDFMETEAMLPIRNHVNPVNLFQISVTFL